MAEIAFLGLGEHAGRQLVPMPLASLIHDRLTATVAKGAKDVDWTAFAREVSVNAGLGGD
ncbi:MAG TPA: hypothetical protein VLJ39_04900 [Tepidisphaeraceae bacterium]|jgi:hypothetical protein|nr:hypothetical protein [Tepidisphaeraceae bacterium]